MDTNTAAAVGIVGFIMSFFFIAVIWYVLCLIARWKVFDKAGIAGWKSLIPIYSDFCTYKIAWKTSYFWIVFAAGIISAFVSGDISGYTEAGEAVPMLLSLLSTVCGFAIMALNLIMNISLAARFGHGILFGLGLTFFGPIFYMILGLGASEYNGNPDEGLPPRRVMYV